MAQDIIETKLFKETKNNNLLSNFEISDISMVAYNLNPYIRSTLLNYKQFILQLNTAEFLQDPSSIKCCCNKYNNSFINNPYSHILQETLILLTMRSLTNAHPKVQSIEKQNKSVLRKLMKK